MFGIYIKELPCAASVHFLAMILAFQYLCHLDHCWRKWQRHILIHARGASVWTGPHLFWAVWIGPNQRSNGPDRFIILDLKKDPLSIVAST